MKTTSGSKLKFELGEIKPLRDKIVSSIREAIIEGRIKAGERLMEPDVARNLGVSRTPLREAFLQLESEGFVKVTPRRGAVVSELSVKDAEETYLIKSALEGLAARLAVKNITEEMLQQLRSINNEMEKKAKQKDKDYRAILELNAKYHDLVNKTSGNEKLCHSISLLRKQTLRYNYIYLNVLSHIDQSIQEHKAIIDALEQRDQKLVEKLVYNHGENAGKILCEYIQTISHADAKA
jgi:DNA-binding GntR family transcriptional regulator